MLGPLKSGQSLASGTRPNMVWSSSENRLTKCRSVVRKLHLSRYEDATFAMRVPRSHREVRGTLVPRPDRSKEDILPDIVGGKGSPVGKSSPGKNITY